MATPYSTDSNEHFADPDAVIPGMPPAPQAQLPPSSSLTSEHIKLHPQPAELAAATAKLSVNETKPLANANPYQTAPLQAANGVAPTSSNAGPNGAPIGIPGTPTGAVLPTGAHIPGQSVQGVHNTQPAHGASGTPAGKSAPAVDATASSAHSTANPSAPADTSAGAPAISKVLRRKLTSFVGFSNLPQQWHQKSIREGFDLNLLVIGDSGLGKSTLLNTLFEVPVHDLDAEQHYDTQEGSGIGISTTKIELNESGVKLRLSVVDTPGYGDHINNLESWKSISDEVDARFDQYLEQEESLQLPNQGSSTHHDPRIHACLFFIDPTGHSLKPLDVVVMKKLHQKVNLVPIIAKADTQTEEELLEFKKMVLAELHAQEITIFEPPSYPFDDEETVSELNDLKQRVPFAVIGSTNLVVNRNGHSVLGREYPWGVVEVMNEDHCDFVKLRSLLIRNHMEDLHERMNVLYEKYRTEKMLKLGVKQDDSVFDMPDPAVRQEEERQQHEQRLAKMETEMRAVFQQKVTEKETKLKSSENELFQKHREIKEQLDKQRHELEQRKQQLQAQIESKQRKSIR